MAPRSPFFGHVTGQLHEGIGSPAFGLHQLPHRHGNTRTGQLQTKVPESWEETNEESLVLQVLMPQAMEHLLNNWQNDSNGTLTGLQRI